MTTRHALIGGGLLALMTSAPLAAEPKPRPRVETKESEDAKARRVVRPRELHVDGDLDKNKAVSITPPVVVLPERTEEPESHLHKILEAVDRDPFQSSGHD